MSSWTLDLAYDASDVQVGSAFNLLVPGGVELDAVTLEQAGRLSGLHGAYRGLQPPPPGNGVLAYVLFTTASRTPRPGPR